MGQWRDYIGRRAGPRQLPRPETRADLGIGVSSSTTPAAPACLHVNGSLTLPLPRWEQSSPTIASLTIKASEGRFSEVININAFNQNPLNIDIYLKNHSGLTLSIFGHYAYILGQIC